MKCSVHKVFYGKIHKYIDTTPPKKKPKPQLINIIFIFLVTPVGMLFSF